MGMSRAKLSKAAQLRAEADRLEKEAFAQRPLPDQWRIGQKVRYLRDSDCAWAKGHTAYVNGLREEYKGRPSADYQVFYTGDEQGRNVYWTTPDDVELIEDAPIPSPDPQRIG